MKSKFFIFLIIYNVTISCANKSADTAPKETNQIHNEEISILDENLFLMGQIESFDFINNTQFVVTTKAPSKIIVFDRNGQQVKEIGTQGRGPYEYQSPTIVRANNDRIYVWDAGQLKLIVYDLFGNPLQEYNEFAVAVKDFRVRENFVSFYFAGGSSDLLGIYDLNENQFIFKGGAITEEHLLLNFNNNAGGMAFFREGLAFLSADDLNLQYLDFKEFDQQSLTSLNDRDFTVNNVDDHSEMTNSDFNMVIEYLMENSYITGLYNLDDKLILKAEVGRFKKIDNVNDASERFKKYYILNEDFELTKIVKVDYNFNENDNLTSSYNGNLYNIKFKDKDDFRYTLNKIEF